MNMEDFEEKDLEFIEFTLNQEELDDLEQIAKLQENMKNKCNLGSDIFNTIEKAALDAVNQIINISDICDGRPDEGAIITTPLNFGKQIFSRDEDRIRYENWEDRQGQFSKRGERKAKNFNDPYQRVRREYLDQNTRADGSILDEYTGKSVYEDPLKVGVESTPNTRINTDHIIPAASLYEDKTLGLYGSESNEKFLDDVSKIANKQENLAATSEHINKSMGKRDSLEYAETHPDEVDKEMVKTKYSEAQMSKNKEITKLAVKNQGKQVVTNLGKSTLAYTGKLIVGETIKVSISEFIIEFKDKSASAGETLILRLKRVFANIGNRLKNSLKDLWLKVKSAISQNIISELFNTVVNFFFTTAKRIFKLIRSMIGSIIKAIKIIFSKDAPMEERIFEALKIISSGLVAATGFLLDEIIEKGIISCLPFLAPIAPTISVVVSGLIASIGSALVLMAFDRYKSNCTFNKQQEEYNNLLVKSTQRNLGLAEIASYKSYISAFQTIQIFEQGISFAAIKHTEIERNFTEIGIINCQIENENVKSDNLKNEIRSLLDYANEIIEK
jgi:hypothetical protein